MKPEHGLRLGDALETWEFESWERDKCRQLVLWYFNNLTGDKPGVQGAGAYSGILSRVKKLFYMPKRNIGKTLLIHLIVSPLLQKFGPKSGIYRFVSPLPEHSLNFISMEHLTFSPAKLSPSLPYTTHQFLHSRNTLLKQQYSSATHWPGATSPQTTMKTLIFRSLCTS